MIKSWLKALSPFTWTENPIRRRSRKGEGKGGKGGERERERERERESRMSDISTESNEGQRCVESHDCLC